MTPASPYIIEAELGASRAGRRVMLKRTWSTSSVLPLALTLVDALVEVYRQGVVHQDIKPQNIIVDGPGVVAKPIEVEEASAAVSDRQISTVPCRPDRAPRGADAVPQGPGSEPDGEGIDLHRPAADSNRAGLKLVAVIVSVGDGVAVLWVGALRDAVGVHVAAVSVAIPVTTVVARPVPATVVTAVAIATVVGAAVSAREPATVAAVPVPARTTHVASAAAIPTAAVEAAAAPAAAEAGRRVERGSTAAKAAPAESTATVEAATATTAVKPAATTAAAVASAPTTAMGERRDRRQRGDCQTRSQQRALDVHRCSLLTYSDAARVRAFISGKP